MNEPGVGDGDGSPVLFSNLGAGRTVPAMTIMAEPEAAGVARVRRRGGAAGAVAGAAWWIGRILLAAAVVLGLVWAGYAGTKLRQEIWTGTRSIHSNADIGQAFRLGDAIVRQASMPPDTFRFDPANWRQWPTQLKQAYGGFIPALVHVYHRPLNLDRGANPDMNNPPLRLAIFALWVRHVQSLYPYLHEWPRGGRVLDPATHQIVAVPDKIADPLLNLSTWCEGAAALAMGLLVWVWVRRESIRPVPAKWARWWIWRGTAEQHEVVEVADVVSAPRPRVPHGLFAFLAASIALWYCVSVVLHPSLPAPPAVSLSAPASVADSSAMLRGLVSGQGVPATWEFEWGPTDAYGHATPTGSVAGAGMTEVRKHVFDLPTDGTVHYCLVARSDRGVTRSPDAVLVTGQEDVQVPPTEVVGRVWPDWSAWIAMVLLFIAAAAAARYLPAGYRGWACGVTAALMVWFSPALLMNAHVWPQWAAWALPTFVIAALLASVNAWFAAGLVIGIGCLVDEQLIYVAPLLVLWPLLGARIAAAGRCLGGAALSSGLLLWPWLMRDPQARQWVACVLIAAAFLTLVSMTRSWLRPRAKALWDNRPDLNPRQFFTEPDGMRAMFTMLKRTPRLPAQVEEEDVLPAAVPVGGDEPFAAQVAVAPPPSRVGPVESAPRHAGAAPYLCVLFAVACIVAGFAVRHGSPALYLAIPATAALLAAIAIARPKHWAPYAVLAAIIGVVVAGGLVLWPYSAQPPGTRLAIVLLLAAIAIIPWLLPQGRGNWPWAALTWLAAAVGVAIWIAAFALGGDFSWYRNGYSHVSPAEQRLVAEPGSLSNLPALLADRYHWKLHDSVTTPPTQIHLAFTDGVTTVDLRVLLWMIYWASLVLCAIGAAIHSRRNDPRLLVALAAPWILLPTLTAPASVRDLALPAAVATAVVGASVGMGLLSVLFALLATGMTAHLLLRSDPSRSALIFDVLNRSWPDLGWMMLLVAAVFLYVAAAPRRRAGLETVAGPLV